MRNYELTNETIEHEGVTLHRIRATRDFVNRTGRTIKSGTIGGWIEKTENLQGNAWVGDRAIVWGDACVRGNAWVGENAQVYGCALVTDYATVKGRARVHGVVKLYGRSSVYGESHVEGRATVSGTAKVFDEAHINGETKIFDSARIHGVTNIRGGLFSENVDVSSNTHFMFIDSCEVFPHRVTLCKTRDSKHHINMVLWSGTLSDLEGLVEQKKFIRSLNNSVDSSTPVSKDILLNLCAMLRTGLETIGE